MPPSSFQLTPPQVKFFNTFGFLKLEGLFKDEIADIQKGFESVFAKHGDDMIVTQYPLHGDERREIIMPFVRKDDYLTSLPEDPRIVGIADSLFNTEYGYNGSDGNLFYCESHWHHDSFGAPLHLRTIKMSFYLDSLTAENGAIRFLPGSNFFFDNFAKSVRGAVDESETRFGVPGSELPSYVMCSEPGDLLLWNFRTLHASYNGEPRRRLFSLNFAELEKEEGKEKKPS